jgi:hypothetical protein
VGVTGSSPVTRTDIRAIIVKVMAFFVSRSGTDRGTEKGTGTFFIASLFTRQDALASPPQCVKHGTPFGGHGMVAKIGGAAEIAISVASVCVAGKAASDSDQ